MKQILAYHLQEKIKYSCQIRTFLFFNQFFQNIDQRVNHHSVLVSYELLNLLQVGRSVVWNRDFRISYKFRVAHFLSCLLFCTASRFVFEAAERARSKVFITQCTTAGMLCIIRRLNPVNCYNSWDMVHDPRDIYKLQRNLFGK